VIAVRAVSVIFPAPVSPARPRPTPVARDEGKIRFYGTADETLEVVPGFRSAAQIEENAGALAAGPLDPDAMAAVDAALGRGAGAR
jgi:hypothetical protein